MIVERLVDRGHEPGVDAVLADLHDRVETMAEAAKMTSLLTAEHGGLYPKTNPLQHGSRADPAVFRKRHASNRQPDEG